MTASTGDSTPDLDLDAWEEIALESERHYGHVGCMECDCGPGIVRALIRELREARALVASQAAAHARQKVSLQRLFAEVDSLTAERDAQAAEIAQLRAERDRLSDALGCAAALLSSPEPS